MKNGSLYLTQKYIGKDKLAQCGIQMARFLNLTGPERYTGHCFKRTGGSQLAEHGATELQIQTSLGWFLLFKSNLSKI
jgi:hypothetical protein